MVVYEICLQICPSVRLPFGQAAEEIGKFIDSAMRKTGLCPAAYKNMNFKLYTFDLPYPLEVEKQYYRGKIYTIRIRTVQRELADFFRDRLPLHSTARIQGLGGELRVIPQYVLERVFSLTPVVVKTKQGYWRGKMPIAEYVKRIQVNLVKKYNQFCGVNLEADFPLFQKLEFQNTKPVRISSKDACLLGDKVSLTAAFGALEQDILYMALGTGVGENNARGCGFLNYRYKKYEVDYWTEKMGNAGHRQQAVR